MSTSGTINVASNCPSFDGTDYPYWKNKIRMHLEAIDKDLWDIVDKGIPEATFMTSPMLPRKSGNLMQKLEASLVDISTRLSSTASVVLILQRRCR